MTGGGAYTVKDETHTRQFVCERKISRVVSSGRIIRTMLRGGLKSNDRINETTRRFGYRFQPAKLAREAVGGSFHCHRHWFKHIVHPRGRIRQWEKMRRRRPIGR